MNEPQVVEAGDVLERVFVIVKGWNRVVLHHFRSYLRRLAAQNPCFGSSTTLTCLTAPARAGESFEEMMAQGGG